MTNEVAVVARHHTEDGVRPTAEAPVIRRQDMNMLIEELARDRMREAQRSAELHRLANRLRRDRKSRIRKGLRD